MRSISDGGSDGDVPGFVWLTPTVKKNLKAFTGAFDPTLSPTIVICPIASDAADGAAACTGPAVRTLSGPSQPEIIRVDPVDENYSVNWHSTEAAGIVVGGRYRAIVYVGTRALGWVDLEAVARQQDASKVDAAYVGFVAGSPFLFKWRIETGIPGALVVTPAAATIKDNASQLFTALVTDLHGVALPGVLVDWTVDDATLATLSPSSGTTNASGQVTTTASARGVVGATTVRASANGLQGTASLTIEPSCTLLSPDTDADRLPDCFETNTKVFVSLTNTGTDPNKRDTDGDNLSDGDEVRGTAMGLDLPALGVNPLRRDLLLEYDWFDDALDCGSHTHRPTVAAIARFATAFATAPVTNPDGTTGVNVINDYGQGGAFTGGNMITDPNGVIAGGVGDAEFSTYKAANFAANRNGYFHFVLLPHRYATTSGSSGQAEIDGDDLIVSLQCFQSTSNVANTIMHELGHNLNLRHGGFENQNYKPNYNSVMNYIYQFPGINNNCTRAGQGILGYSTGVRIDLNETNIDERQGLCGNPPGPGIDWNGDGDATDFGYARNLNPSNDNVISPIPLRDFNDWMAIKLSGIGDADGASLRVSVRAPKEIISCDPVPPQ